MLDVKQCMDNFRNELARVFSGFNVPYFDKNEKDMLHLPIYTNFYGGKNVGDNGRLLLISKSGTCHEGKTILTIDYVREEIDGVKDPFGFKVKLSVYGGIYDGLLANRVFGERSAKILDNIGNTLGRKLTIKKLYSDLHETHSFNLYVNCESKENFEKDIEVLEVIRKSMLVQYEGYAIQDKVEIEERERQALAKFRERADRELGNVPCEEKVCIEELITLMRKLDMQENEEKLKEIKAILNM